MQIIDTNAAHIDEIISKKHDFGYLNGYLHVSNVENLNKYFVDYCEEIKVSLPVSVQLEVHLIKLVTWQCAVIAIYNPRYPKNCTGLKRDQVSTVKKAIDRLTYYQISCPCVARNQTTFDIALSKIGGVRQLLMLIAQVGSRLPRWKKSFLLFPIAKLDSRLCQRNLRAVARDTTQSSQQTPQLKL
jgi:hypothetical protein